MSTKVVYSLLRNEIAVCSFSLVAGGITSKIATLIFPHHTKKIYTSGVIASLFTAEWILFRSTPGFLAEEVVKGRVALKDAFIRGESLPLLRKLLNDHSQWSQEHLDFPFFLEHREGIRTADEETRQKVAEILQELPEKHSAFLFLKISEKWFFEALPPWQEHYLRSPTLLDQLVGESPSADYGQQAVFWWGKFHGFEGVPEPTLLAGPEEAKKFLKSLAKYAPETTLGNSKFIIDFIE